MNSIDGITKVHEIISEIRKNYVYKCEHCGHDCKANRYENVALFIYCDNCMGKFNTGMPNKSLSILGCSHPQTKVVKIVKSDRIYIRNQCKDCGNVVGKVIKRTFDHRNLNHEIPTKKLLHFEDIAEKIRKFISDCYKQMIDKNNELRDKKTDDFWDKYTTYLKSDTWKQKRIKVLKRDNFICQACLEEKAIDVHHTTYTHVFDEPLFQLVSVCKKCHEKIHEK